MNIGRNMADNSQRVNTTEMCKLWRIYCAASMENYTESRQTTDAHDNRAESQKLCAKCKKPLTKKYLPNYPIYTTFWRKNKRDKK